jgi:hypothetical protein
MNVVMISDQDPTVLLICVLLGLLLDLISLTIHTLSCLLGIIAIASANGAAFTVVLASLPV